LSLLFDRIEGTSSIWTARCRLSTVYEWAAASVAKSRWPSAAAAPRSSPPVRQPSAHDATAASSRFVFDQDRSRPARSVPEPARFNRLGSQHLLRLVWSARLSSAEWLSSVALLLGSARFDWANLFGLKNDFFSCAAAHLVLSPSPWDLRLLQVLSQCCDVRCFSMAPTIVTGFLACVCTCAAFDFGSFSRASFPAHHLLRLLLSL
jgi:hypothetical protein